MKKIVSIALVAVMTASITSCSQRNTALRNMNRYNNPGTTTGLTNVAYKDGVYTADGDKTPHGIERAVVTIRNGRIADIDLKRLDTTGKEITMVNRTTGTTTGMVGNPPTYNANTGTPGSMTGIPSGTTGGNLPYGYTTPGGTSYNAGTSGGATNGITGGNAGGAARNITGNMGTSTDYTNPRVTTGRQGTTTGTYYGPNYGTTGTTTNYNANVPGGNAVGGGVTANLGQTRSYLITQMIQAQTWDVKTSTTQDIDVVNNWKLAVRRALDKARR